MREMVMAGVDELGVRANVIAAGLRSQETMSIGYVVSNLSNPVLAHIVTGAESRLRASGYSLILTNSEGVAALDASNVSVLLGRRIDGLLLSLSREDDEATIEAIRELDVPFVIVDRFPPPGMDAWCITFDHRAGMAAATRHLMDSAPRHRRFILGCPSRPAVERPRCVEDTPPP